MKKLPNLPIGQHSFGNIRDRNSLYIDKTDLILRLIKEGRSYFLSRPRRMGKSLLVSTLEAIFEGRRELFDGLAIADSGYDFKPYPVVRLDFGGIDTRSLENFKSGLCKELQYIATEHNVGKLEGSPTAMLAQLIRALAQHEQVVLLIDEFQKPFVSNIEDLEQAKPFHKFLTGFCDTIKALVPELRFTFITGVSRFSTTSIFSGMNHLNDLSLDDDYATLVGITEAELTRYLLPYVSKTAQEQELTEAEVLGLARQWYNGYRFAGGAKVSSVYNPHSLFCFLDDGQITNYWFETGTPTFAIKLIRQQLSTDTTFDTGVKLPGSMLESSFELDNIALEPLLYQIGYLTITDYDSQHNKYTLGFPNEEVRRSYHESLSRLFKTSAVESQPTGEKITPGH